MAEQLFALTVNHEPCFYREAGSVGHPAQLPTWCPRLWANSVRKMKHFSTGGVSFSCYPKPQLHTIGGSRFDGTGP